MISTLSKFTRWCLRIVIGLFLLACLGFALLQSKWTKKQMQTWIVELAAAQGYEVSLSSIEGRFPFSLKIRDLMVRYQGEEVLFAPTLKIRLAFFPLMRKEIAIAYLHSPEIFLYLKKEETQTALTDSCLTYPPDSKQENKSSSLALPFHFSIRYLKIASLHLKVDDKESAAFAIEGRGSVKKGFKHFYLDAKAIPIDSTSSYVSLAIHGDKIQQSASVHLVINMSGPQLFRPFFEIPYSPHFSLDAHLKGGWKTWQALIQESNPPALLPPLQGLIDLEVREIEIPDAAYLDRLWKISSDFSLNTDHSLTINKTTVHSDLAHVEGAGAIDATGELTYAQTTWLLPNLSLFSPAIEMPMEGTIHGKAYYDRENAQCDLIGKRICLGKEFFDSMDLQITATNPPQKNPSADAENETGWRGKMEIKAKHPFLSFNGESHFQFFPNRSLKFSDFSLAVSDSALYGNLEWQFCSHLLLGSFYARVPELHTFQTWAPNADLKGSGGVAIHFTQDPQYGDQKISINTLVNQLHYNNSSAEEFALKAEVINPFYDPRGNISIEGNKVQLDKLFLSSLHFEALWEEGKWPFDLLAKGAWEDQLEVHAQGYLKKTPEQTFIQCDDFVGFMLKKPFGLEKPFSLAWGKGNFLLQDLDMKIADGHLSAEVGIDEKKSQFHLKAEHFPLDVLSLSYPLFFLKGSSSFEAVFSATPENIQGRMNLLLEEVALSQTGRSTSLQAKGSLDAHLDNKILQVQSHLIASNDQYLDWSATLPIAYSHFPLHVSIDTQRPFASELTAEGNIEEIFDFINLGSHRTTGHLSAHLYFSKNLQKPAVVGKIDVANGSYENYYTGTYLKNIDALIEAENHTMKLLSFNAQDNQKGRGAMLGELLLSAAEKFPYSLHAVLDKLQVLKLDTLTSNFTGDLSLTGNGESSTLKGTLTLSDADVQISDQKTIDVPVLPVTFMHTPAPEEAEEEVVSPAEFHWDVKLLAPDSIPGPILVRGRGLRSEWEGELHLSDAPEAMGKAGSLHLLRGEFSFSGKTFSLSKGEITFSDIAHQEGNLQISGTLTLPDVTITMHLNGAIQTPQLTFQSMPHMPTSSILARILFDKDVSEISPMQAIQLANAIVTLSGGPGPDVLDKIRKSLGIDRLTIVSGPNGLEDVSVQIGKYLIKGVMVTLSQGTSSSKIIVEAELKHGFLLQAEKSSDDDEEAKFSLKWNRNY